MLRVDKLNKAGKMKIKKEGSYLKNLRFFFYLFYFSLLLFIGNLSAQGPDTLWTKTYGGINYDESYSVQETNDGGFIVAGLTVSFEGLWLLKLNENGDTLWTKTYGEGAGGRSIYLTSDDCYIIAGYGPGEYGTDVWLLKTNVNGDSLWLKTYNHSIQDWGNEIKKTSDGGYIIAGGSGIQTHAPDAYIVKTDSNGDSLWARVFYGGLIDTIDAEANSVRETSDGGYIVVGHREISGFGDRDIFLIKMDENGDSLWTKKYGGYLWDEGYSVDQTLDGGYIIAGYSDSDVYLVRTKPDNSVLEKLSSKTIFENVTIYPNPFTTNINIKYSEIKDGQNFRILIYDISGSLVKDFASCMYKNNLTTTLLWDGKDNNDNKVPAGIYFFKFEMGEYSSTRKILKIR
jgi:hypothetical protein